MIGVIGPADSIELVRSAARAEGLDPSTLLLRSYDSADTVAELAMTLDAACHVLLFTGEVPYTICREMGTLQSTLRYIRHSTNDLYRTVIRVLRENNGRLPTLSIDTIDVSAIEEVFQDLKNPTGAPAYQSLALWREPHFEMLTTDELTQFHVDRYARNMTEVALTCLHDVDVRLSAEGVPHWRIEHTTSSVQNALRDAHMTVQIQRSSAMQAAEGLIELPTITPAGPDMNGTLDSQRRRVRMLEALLDYANGMQGALGQIDETIFRVHTTRGAIDTALERIRGGHKTAIRPDAALAGVKIGYGIGHSVKTAEGRAWRALDLARRTDAIHVAFDNGEIVNIEEDLDVRGRGAAGSPETPSESFGMFGLGHLVLERLTAALRRIDTASVTAHELGEAYGITTRSARRILSILEEAGVAIEVSEVRKRATGRPPRVYRIRYDRLLAAIGSEHTDSGTASIEDNADG